jgi:DNA-binding PadR family transcriptional regulator
MANPFMGRVHPNSIQSYYQCLQKDTFTKHRRKILYILWHERPLWLCTAELSELLTFNQQVYPGSITGELKRLEESGCLEVKNMRSAISNKVCNHYQLSCLYLEWAKLAFAEIDKLKPTHFIIPFSQVHVSEELKSRKKALRELKKRLKAHDGEVKHESGENFDKFTYL